MSEPLAVQLGAARKVMWGNDHNNRLAMSVREFNRLHPTRPVANLTQRDHKEGTFTIEWRLQDVVRPDATWPLMVGDALNCYRSALDHIVSEHLRIERGMTPDQLAGKKYQFPIYDTSGKFKRGTTDLSAVASEEFISELRRAQKFTLPGAEAIQHSTLSALRDLNNLDKHRGLPLTESYIQYVEGSLQFDPSVDFISFDHWEAPALNGTLVVRAKIRGPITQALTSIKFQTLRVETVHIPGLDEPQEISQLLWDISQDVQALVGAFFADPGEHAPDERTGCPNYHDGEWHPAHS